MGGGQDHRSVSSYFGRVIWFSPARKLGIVARWLLRFRACDSTIGFSGLKIVDPAAPYFDGVNINRGDIIRIPYNSEFDGFPNLGLNADDATGFPIVDPEYANDFYYFDLLMLPVYVLNCFFCFGMYIYTYICRIYISYFLAKNVVFQDFNFFLM